MVRLGGSRRASSARHRVGVRPLIATAAALSVAAALLSPVPAAAETAAASETLPAPTAASSSRAGVFWAAPSSTSAQVHQAAAVSAAASSVAAAAGWPAASGLLAAGPGVVVLAQPGGFLDVPGDAYYSTPVAELAAAGVFAGTECVEGFCPGEPVDRKTMAVWTVRVLDGVDPPAVSESRFDDVDAAGFHARFIERMAELGVTRGCGDGTNFCPERSVSRAQMAVFLSRAYSLPDGSDPGFADVPADAWYAADVARLAASGITVGCGDGTVFCPSRATTRAQMATFLWRAENRIEPETSPGELEVVQQEVLDSSGGVVEAGGTVVRVPAGAVDEPVQVEIREPLGVFGTVEGGAVVGIEHRGPLAAPVTVAWDVGHLSDAQLRSILLVRWDSGLSQWLPVDVDYEIAAGVLTAEIQQWSWTTWIAEVQDTAANISQTFQEILGRRVDAPECSGGLPEWVTNTVEPDEGANAAAIRLCYEYRGGEAVTMRMANNRVFSQFVYSDTPGAWGDTVEGPLPRLSILGVLHQVASKVFSDDTRVFMPPLTQAAVAIGRPQGPVTHTIHFHREHTAETFLGDVVFFVGSKLPTPTGTAAFEVVGVFLTVLFECSAPRLFRKVGPDEGLWELFSAAVGATRKCIESMQLPTTDEYTKLTKALAKKSLSLQEFRRLFNAETLSGLKGALRALAVAEAFGIFFDLAADEWAESTPWSIKVQGRIASLGDWTPTCSDTEEDSNRLFLNLVLRKPFTTATALGDLRTFDSWRPSAEEAVAPLADCGNSHKVNVAADVDDTWGIEPADKGIVRDLILEMVAPDPTGGYSAITAGDSHTCALSADGVVACWGDNTHGRLYEPDGQYSAIAAGGRHTCGIRTDGTVECWGDNTDGQLDAPAGEFRAITAGWNHSCAVRSDNTVECWGGYFATDSVRPQQGVHATSPEGHYSDVAAGWIHTCAILTNGTIECWGSKDEGQLDAPVGQFRAIAAGFTHSCAIRSSDNTIECWGDDSRDKTNAPVGQFRAIAAGRNHSCAIGTDNNATCWGIVGSHGQLDAPEDQYSAIAAGWNHSCAIRTNGGTITCWGNNNTGQTDAPGDTDPPDDTTGGTAPNTTAPPPTPTAASNAVTAGGSHSCGLLSSGTITCWGQNEHGQADAPAGTFKAVTAGGSHSCGLLSSGTITCWGQNVNGQADAPAGTFKAVDAGYVHSCGLRSNDTITCWGYNYYGQADAPAGTFKAVTAGTTVHSCGLRSSGTITCWGDNGAGQSDAPAGTFKAVTAGSDHSCGLRSKDTITCWGGNAYGQADAPAGTFKAVTAGDGYSCGLLSHGTITCWGYNGFGESDAPAGTFKAVTVGSHHSCGLRSNDTITCWGHNYYGEADAPSGTFGARGDGPTVAVSKGGLGPTSVGPGEGVPCAPDTPTCRYLNVELRNFAAGTYTVSCSHDGWQGDPDPSTFWTFTVTVGESGSASSDGPCFINFAKLTGNGAYVTVSSTGTDTITSNWLK